MIDKVYEDQNILKIRETHHLLDKIEQRVKSFIRKDDAPVQKSLSFQLTPSAQKLKIENRNTTIDYSLEQMKNLDQSSQFYLLKEIKDIDNSYKTEIEALKSQVQQMHHTIQQLLQQQQQDKSTIEQKSSLIVKLYDQIEHLQQSHQSLKQENQQLINELSILSSHRNEKSSRTARTISVNKISDLQRELHEERNKSENLKSEIQKIKEKIEETSYYHQPQYNGNKHLKQIIQQQQSVSHSHIQNKSFNKENQASFINSSHDNLEKTLKRIEQAQQKQTEYNQYFMNCVKELQQSQSKIDPKQLDYYPTKEQSNNHPHPQSCNKRSQDGKRQAKRGAFKIPLRPNLL